MTVGGACSEGLTLDLQADLKQWNEMSQVTSRERGSTATRHTSVGLVRDSSC